MTTLRLAPGRTIAEARRDLAQAFRSAGLDTPDLDARILVGHALGLDHGGLINSGERPLDEAALDRIHASAIRRLDREPVARIVGHKEFWGLDLALAPATLVPRPDTELVVETALTILDQTGGRARPFRIADLGTGSGAILLALLSECTHAIGFGTDISLEALTTARANAHRHGLESRAGFVACDYGAALAGAFDLVVSNPPYIASGEIAALAPEVRAFDPQRALDGGADGLSGYRVIAADAKRLLAPGGHLIVELGPPDGVREMFAGAGLIPGNVKNDLGGRARVLCARLAGNSGRDGEI